MQGATFTRILAIRHGETDWNAAQRIQGQLDIGLNARGNWQAQQLVPALADETIDAVYTSDLQRARATAAPLAARRGCAVVCDAGLRERAFGVFEGHTPVEVEQRWPEQSRRWRSREADFGVEGGETLNQFFARCLDTTTRLALAHAGQTIVLVTHGGVLDCLYRAATRVALDAPRTWMIDNAAVNRLLHTVDGYTLIGWSDNQHLDGAALQWDDRAP